MDFFGKGSQIRRKLWIWSYLLKKSLVENLIFCAAFDSEVTTKNVGNEEHVF